MLILAFLPNSPGMSCLIIKVNSVSSNLHVPILTVNVREQPLLRIVYAVPCVCGVRRGPSAGQLRKAERTHDAREHRIRARGLSSASSWRLEAHTKPKPHTHTHSLHCRRLFITNVYLIASYNSVVPPELSEKFMTSAKQRRYVLVSLWVRK